MLHKFIFQKLQSYLMYIVLLRRPTNLNLLLSTRFYTGHHPRYVTGIAKLLLSLNFEREEVTCLELYSQFKKPHNHLNACKKISFHQIPLTSVIKTLGELEID